MVVGFNSHYPGLRIVRQKHGKDVVMALKSVFAPDKTVADNMPFGSYAMNAFASKGGF